MLRFFFLLAAAILVVGVAVPARILADPGPGGDEMTTYYVGLLHKGAKWTPEQSPEVEKLLQAHLENIRRLVGAGKLVLAGPFADDGDLRGMFVFLVPSLEEARELCDSDPAVKAGRLRVELHPWYGPKGIRFEKPPGGEGR